MISREIALCALLLAGCSEESYQPPPVTEEAPTLSPREQKWQETLQVWRHGHADFLSDPSRVAALDKAIAELERETNGRLSSGRLIVLAQERAFRATDWDVAKPEDWQRLWDQVTRDWEKRHAGFLSEPQRTATINAVTEQLWPNRMQSRPEEFMAMVEEEAFRRTKWRQYASRPAPQLPAEYYSLEPLPDADPQPKAVKDYLNNSLPAK